MRWTLKQTLFRRWNFMRMMRLGFGIFFIVGAIQSHDSLAGLAGAFFFLTAITNVGCCGAGHCQVAVTGKALPKTGEIP